MSGIHAPQPPPSLSIRAAPSTPPLSTLWLLPLPQAASLCDLPEVISHLSPHPATWRACRPSPLWCFAGRWLPSDGAHWPCSVDLLPLVDPLQIINRHFSVDRGASEVPAVVFFSRSRTEKTKFYRSLEV